MHSDQDPSEKNRHHPRIRQTAVSGVTAETISIGQIVQKIVYLGLPFNSSHRRFAQAVSVVTYIACVVAGFIRLVQGDAGFITKLLLIVGSGLLSLTCLYYAWFWQPEYQDNSPPISDLSPSDEQVKAQQVKQRQRKQVRRSAIVGVFAIPLVTFAGFFTWQNLPTKDTIILVAQFNNQQSNSDNHLVTVNIIEALRNATREYADIKVLALEESITAEEGGEIARAEGKQRKATIVIWGWYDKTPQAVQVSTHFEVLKPPEIFPGLGQEATGAIRTIPAPIARLEHYDMQRNLSKEMTYLSLFTTGMALYTAEDWNGAIAHFTDALNQVKEPVSALDQGNVYNARGTSYRSQGDYDRALADYTQAVETNPKDHRPYFNKGLVYLYRKGDFTLAVDAFTQVIQLKPDSESQALSYKGRGTAYQFLGDYDRAIADLTQAIQFKPAPSSDIVAEAYINRGLVHNLQGHHDLEIADYTQAIQVGSNKTDISAYAFRGNIYSSQGDYDRAIADFTQLIQLNPDDAEAYNSRGSAYFQKGFNDLAINDYRRSVRLNSDNAKAYLGLGSIYLQRGNYTRAIDNLTRAIQLSPKLELSFQDDPKLALLDSIRAKARKLYKPFLSLTHCYRGIAYQQRGDNNNAINDFKEVLELTPEDSTLRQCAEQGLQELGVQ